MASCRLCGKYANDIGGYLIRVNPKGMDGVWECSPSCAAELTNENKLLSALESGSSKNASEGR